MRFYIVTMIGLLLAGGLAAQLTGNKDGAKAGNPDPKNIGSLLDSHTDVTNGIGSKETTTAPTIDAKVESKNDTVVNASDSKPVNNRTPKHDGSDGTDITSEDNDKLGNSTAANDEIEANSTGVDVTSAPSVEVTISDDNGQNKTDIETDNSDSTVTSAPMIDDDNVTRSSSTEDSAVSNDNATSVVNMTSTTANPNSVDMDANETSTVSIEATVVPDNSSENETHDAVTVPPHIDSSNASVGQNDSVEMTPSPAIEPDMTTSGNDTAAEKPRDNNTKDKTDAPEEEVTSATPVPKIVTDKSTNTTPTPKPTTPKSAANTTDVSKQTTISVNSVKDNYNAAKSKRLALGIIIPCLVVFSIIGLVFAYRKLKKKGRGYITLDDLGNFQGMNNPNYDPEL